MAICTCCTLALMPKLMGVTPCDAMLTVGNNELTYVCQFCTFCLEKNNTYGLLINVRPSLYIADPSGLQKILPLPWQEKMTARLLSDHIPYSLGSENYFRV